MNSPLNPLRLVVVEDYAELCVRVSQKLAESARENIRTRRRFNAALCGGSTPGGIYKALAAHKDIDWAKVDFFLGDERFVPLNSARSNYKMIVETLAGPAARRVRSVETSAINPDATAEIYEEQLREYFQAGPGGFPVFDVILLGLGEDGHTASLFPNTPALQEKKHWAVAVEPGNTPEPRISLTLPVINNASCVIFAVNGAAKAAMVKNALSRSSTGIPAQMVRPSHGELIWFVDRAAAVEIQTS